MTYTADLLDANFKTQPFAHQLAELEIYGLDPARALVWQMRTGKSKTIIDTACMLYQRGEIKSVLLIAPNGVHRNWPDRELPAHSWQPYKSYFWMAKDKTLIRFKETILSNKLKWFCYPTHGIIIDRAKAEIKEIIKNHGPVLLVFDECHDFRKPGSKRSRVAAHIAKHCKYKRILSGTPLHNSPLHAFSQYRLLEDNALGAETYEEFKRTYCVMRQGMNSGRQTFERVERYINLDKLSAHMNKYTSYVLRSDCSDMPDLVEFDIECGMTELQKKAYNGILNHFIAEIRDGVKISLAHKMARMIKLQQISSGFIIDEDKNTHIVDNENYRLNNLIDQCEKTEGKIVIWCMFKFELDFVRQALEKLGHKCLSYHGRTKEEERTKVKEAFAPDAKNDYKALIAHPKSAGQGLNLSAAGKIVWFSHTFCAITRSQALERATQIGGQNVQIVNLKTSPIDDYIIESVRKKVDIATTITAKRLEGLIVR